MEARVKWAGDLTFVGHGNTGHGVVMDAGTADGGLGIGASPMEMLLMGAGGCASIDVVMILGKARQKVTDLVIELSGERAEAPPRVFTNIHMHFKVTGENLDHKHVARAIDLTMSTYCSASQTLAKAVDLTHDFAVFEADRG